MDYCVICWSRPAKSRFLIQTYSLGARWENGPLLDAHHHTSDLSHLSGYRAGMETFDDLEHPLLGNSPKSPCVGTEVAGGVYRGILVRCDDEKTLHSLAWRGYCSSTDIHQQQFLDPCTLPNTLDSIYSTGPMWVTTDSLGLHSKDYLETTFVDIGPNSLDPLERKLLGEAKEAHNLSYSMDDDEDDLLPDFEVCRFHCHLHILNIPILILLFMSRPTIWFVKKSPEIYLKSREFVASWTSFFHVISLYAKSLEPLSSRHTLRLVMASLSVLQPRT